MIRSGYRIGLLPQQLYELELWEFMLLQKQWAQQEEQRQRELVRQSWLTARFTGAAFAGKLRGLESYLAKSNSTRAPKVSRTEFDDLYAKAKGGDAHGAEESCG